MSRCRAGCTSVPRRSRRSTPPSRVSRTVAEPPCCWRAGPVAARARLVEYAVQRGRERGARTWVVRARHLASAAPFEVLRRLLGPAVEEAGGVDALEGAARFAIPLFTPGADLSYGVDYGCQWLVAWLAERSPLVLAIDDAHWADGASLRVLLDVQADISVQPVTMLVASRPVENPEVQPLLAAMAAQPDCEVLAPATLSREAVAEVVAEKLGYPAQDAFVDECLQGLARQRVLPPRAAAALPDRLTSQPSDLRPQGHPVPAADRRLAAGRAGPRGDAAGAGGSGSGRRLLAAPGRGAGPARRGRRRSTRPLGSRWPASCSTATPWSSCTRCCARRWRPSCPTW